MVVSEKRLQNHRMQWQWAAGLIPGCAAVLPGQGGQAAVLQSIAKHLPPALLSAVEALPRLGRTYDSEMERIEGQVNEGDTILIDHSDGRTFFVKVESGK